MFFPDEMLDLTAKLLLIFFSIYISVDGRRTSVVEVGFRHRERGTVPFFATIVGATAKVTLVVYKKNAGLLPGGVPLEGRRREGDKRGRRRKGDVGILIEGYMVEPAQLAITFSFTRPCLNESWPETPVLHSPPWYITYSHQPRVGLHRAEGSPSLDARRFSSNVGNSRFNKHFRFRAFRRHAGAQHAR